MDASISCAKMMEAVKQASQSAHCKAFGWTFEVDEAALTVYVKLKHRRRSHEPFTLRVVFDDYPQRAPSYVFVDPLSKEESASAWPPRVRHDAHPRICTPGTREFYEQLHRGDAQHPWDPGRITFLLTVAEIHRLMEAGIGG